MPAYVNVTKLNPEQAENAERRKTSFPKEQLENADI